MIRPSYYIERHKLNTHRLLDHECIEYWAVHERGRGHQYPLGYMRKLQDAERVIKALNLLKQIEESINADT